ncbi:MAG: 3-phosphoshikimate 1-carboxyvinyltransferase [Deltaproteobacteria bacterium]|jgi:3-phosphoshikimate 1-carboxyvinyltransferase|nr:3-phosphoshikimate 1-carboxyvinyltransferase [Deltaproteobacteria bacterium]
MPLIGKFTPPGDKSISHRLILFSILAQGEMLVKGLSNCEDVLASLKIFRQLGGRAEEERGGLRVWGLDRKIPEGEVYDLYCANSGTTIRLLTGILAGVKGEYVLDGDAQLRRRPMERVAEPLRQMGAKIETLAGKPPVKITGGALNPVEYLMRESSAQLKGAVLLAGFSAAGGPTTVVEKDHTRTHTERLLDYFGGRVESDRLRHTVYPGTLALKESFDTPADPSSAAFFLTAAAFIPGSSVTAENILLSQARTGFLRVLERMGASVRITMTSDTPEPVGDVTVEYQGELSGTEVPSDQVPSLIDEIPILALAATRAGGETVFRQVDELRIKETDRLMSIRHQLGALGARVWIEGDDLHIEGPTSFIIPPSLDSGKDHRLAMTLVLALLAAGARTPILGEESIPVSYPTFHKDLSLLWRDRG